MLPDKNNIMEPLLDNNSNLKLDKSINKTPPSNRTSLADEEERFINTNPEQVTKILH